MMIAVCNDGVNLGLINQNWREKIRQVKMRKNAARKININAMQKLQKWGQFPLKKLDLRVQFGGGAGFIGGLVWARIYVR